MSTKKPSKSSKKKVEGVAMEPKDLVSNMPSVPVVVEPEVEKVYQPIPGAKEQKVYTMRLEHHDEGALFDEEPRLNERIRARLKNGKSYYGSVQQIEDQYFFIDDDQTICVVSWKNICNYYYSPKVIHD